MASGDSGDFSGEKFGENYFITHSKLSKRVKSVEIVSNRPIIFVDLFLLANEISQISSILSAVIRLF